jgi:hypothetical protein
MKCALLSAILEIYPKKMAGAYLFWILCERTLVKKMKGRSLSLVQQTLALLGTAEPVKTMGISF